MCLISATPKVAVDITFLRLQFFGHAMLDKIVVHDADAPTRGCACPGV